MKTELYYGLDDKPPLRETVFVALQHVFAVFVGIITPPLIICNALKLDRANTKDNVGYAVFGRVIDGMDVVDAIRRVKTEEVGGHEDVPVKDVIIRSARRAAK